jgi:hypothetical protein
MTSGDLTEKITPRSGDLSENPTWLFAQSFALNNSMQIDHRFLSIRRSSEFAKETVVLRITWITMRCNLGAAAVKRMPELANVEAGVLNMGEWSPELWHYTLVLCPIFSMAVMGIRKGDATAVTVKFVSQSVDIQYSTKSDPNSCLRNGLSLTSGFALKVAADEESCGFVPNHASN